MESPASFLKGVPLFRGLPPRELSALARIARVEELPSGRTLFAKASRGDTLYMVMKGAIKIFSRSRSGKAKTFAWLEARDFFGEMALLGGGVRNASALAMEPTRLLAIRRRDFESLVKRRPEISLDLLRALCERLDKADREIETFSFNSVLGRTAQLLLDLAVKYGKKTPSGLRIDKELSQRELADMAGTAREMISRVLSRFVRTGCVVYDGRFLTLTDAVKLKTWIY
jgi:CRP/FNR family transcriptional regulator, cyclic AMP receptor protein